MVTIVVNPKGVAQGRFARVEEYALYCFFGSAGVPATEDDLLSDVRRSETPASGRVSFELEPTPGHPMVSGWCTRCSSTRTEPDRRSVGKTPRSASRSEVAGDPERVAARRRSRVEAPTGTVAVWPLRRDGSLGVWQAVPDTLMSLAEKGFTKCVLRPEGWAISYVPNGVRTKIDSGRDRRRGYDDDFGTAILEMEPDLTRAKTVWKRARHDAGWHGSVVMRKLLNAGPSTSRSLSMPSETPSSR